MSLIKLVNVSKVYPNKSALNQVNFQLQKGEIHGLLGQNGAGKTTLMRILSGLSAPTSGQVVYAENPLSMGVLLENPPLYQDMRALEYLLFVARIQGLAGQLAKTAAQETLEKVGLSSQREQLVGTLSRGQKQKLALGQALVFSPQILVLDEPTIGLDPLAVMEIRELIVSLKGEHTILFSTHILSEVEEICDSCSIIHHGQILHSGPLAPITQEQKLETFFRHKIQSGARELSV